MRRAQGKPGAQHTHSLACEIGKHTSKSTTGLPKQSGLPCAMVYGLFRDLLGETGLFCHRHPRDAQSIVANLAPASGRQDHTALPSAPMLFVEPTPLRPSHPAPNVRDDREAPLSRGAGCANHTLFPDSEKQKYFCREGWTRIRASRLSGESLGKPHPLRLRRGRTRSIAGRPGRAAKRRARCVRRWSR